MSLKPRFYIFFYNFPGDNITFLVHIIYQTRNYLPTLFFAQASKLEYSF